MDGVATEWWGREKQEGGINIIFFIFYIYIYILLLTTTTEKKMKLIIKKYIYKIIPSTFHNKKLENNNLFFS